MKRLSTIILLFTIVLMASAQKITAEKALQKARTFSLQMKANESKGQTHKDIAVKQLATNELLSNTSGDELFLFNIGTNDGFVIVSGDERTPDVLGYADNGSIDTENMPANMRAWLEGYAHEIANLQQSGIEIQYVSAAHPAISPLVTSKWDQDAPYNLQCPSIGGQRCVTGCVATAMAQVLYKVRPVGSRAIEARGNAPTTLPATTFNWSLMRDSYVNNDQSTAAQEVAKLMRYCGQAAAMEYSTGASSSNSFKAADGLKKYFNISNSCHIIERQLCLSSTWDETIYNELRNQRPVIIGGQNAGSNTGHEFVCDGYDGAGRYHINWGWGGTSNGYFLISALDPDKQGIGGSNSGYNSDVDAIIGIKIKDLSETQENISVLTINNIMLQNTTFTRNSYDIFYINIPCAFYNMNVAGIYQSCWGIYDSSDNLIETSTIDETNFPQASGYSKYTYYIQKNLPDGTYKIKHISRQKDAETWCMSNNAEYFIITATVSGNTMTLTPPVMKGSNENYQISNVSITGNGLVGVAQTIQMTVKNTGDTFSGAIYIAELKGNEIDIFGSISTNIDPGQTQTLTGSVTFNTAGTHTLTFYKAVSNGFVPLSGSITYTINEQSYTILDLSIKPATPYTVEEDVYIINQSKLELECTMENVTNTPYRSYIHYWCGTDGHNYSHINYVFAEADALSTTKVKHEVTDLEENILYYCVPSYHKSANVYNDVDFSKKIKVMYKNTSTSIDSVTTSPDTTSDDAIYTLDGRRVSGSAPLHGIYIKGGKKIAF